MTTNQSRRPHVVLGVCGGIAAYKAVELCRRLTGDGYSVSPVLTENARHFIGAATFAALTPEPVRDSLWTSPEPSPHTKLGQSADVVVVAPATARLIGAYANGISDDFLVTTLLATRAPVVLAPAMHTEMWEHPAVQANIATLKERGVVIVDPEAGELAGGDVGVGRLASVDKIVAAVTTLAATEGALRGRRILVTAGGTKEPLDPVRYLGNHSSGRQGYAIAQVAQQMGAQVVLVTAAELVAPSGVDVIAVRTAEQMRDAVISQLSDVDIVVMAAAVADFRPVSVATKKLKKAAGVPEFRLEPTVDILSEIANKRTAGQLIVGFAAETNDVETAATTKLESKNLDFIVANDVSAPGAGFGHTTNSVLILDKFGRKYETGLVEKTTVAKTLLDLVVEQLGGTQ